MNDQDRSDYRPVFILCPGRSFSSVVCGMLGQHPELYGLPETNFFVADTLGGVFRWFRKLGPGNPHRLDGLARTIAQLHEGEQTEATVERAWQWLRERPDMPTGELARHVARLLENRRFVEKSPSNCRGFDNLIRLYRTFPKACFLHLVRHPRSTGKSIYEIHRGRQGKDAEATEGKNTERIENYWFKVHDCILRFTERLPARQSIRLQGELLLTDPDRYLRQVAEWLEIRTDAAAIEAMKHPENSPFAEIGPANALGGNDRKYMENPKLRSGAPPRVNLTDPLDWMPDGSGFGPATMALARRFGYR